MKGLSSEEIVGTLLEIIEATLSDQSSQEQLTFADLFEDRDSKRR